MRDAWRPKYFQGREQHKMQDFSGKGIRSREVPCMCLLIRYTTSERQTRLDLQGRLAGHPRVGLLRQPRSAFSKDGGYLPII